MRISSGSLWLALVAVTSFGSFCFAQEAPPQSVQSKPNTAVIPATKGAAWERRHQGFVERAQKGDVDLLFLGDSITDFWARAESKPIWDKYYGNRKAANFGISADRTQNVLWRLENGETKGIQPKVVVLLIGTNNTGIEGRGNPAPRNTTEEATAGVKAVIAKLRELLPESKLLVLAIFPRGEAADPQRDQIKQINAAIKASTEKDSHVTFLDIGEKFLAADGAIPADVMPDKLHPGAKGYEIWAEAMEPTLAKLLAP